MENRIRQIMEHFGFSQQNFAAKLDVAPATISSIFTGRTNPTNKLVQAIHKAFPTVDTNWLMFGEGEMMLTQEGAEMTLGEIEGESGVSVNASDRTLFGEDAHESVFGNPNSNMGYSAASSGGNTRGMRRDGAGIAQQYGGMLEVANLMDKKMRKIKEIRVFYDDGTFEVFSPSSK